MDCGEFRRAVHEQTEGKVLTLGLLHAWCIVGGYNLRVFFHQMARQLRLLVSIFASEFATMARPGRKGVHIKSD